MARSGRWRGPYTVKKRRQATRTPYRWAKACAISSPARLLAAYGEIGQTARASSDQRAGVERVEVVGAHALVPPRKQRLTQVGADEARRPRDQEASAHAATSPRK